MKKLLLTLAALLMAATAMASHYVTFIPSETPPSSVSSGIAYLHKDDISITLSFNADATTEYYYCANGYIYVYTYNDDQRLMSVEFVCERSFITTCSRQGQTTWLDNGLIWQDGYTDAGGVFHPYTEEDYQNGSVAASGDSYQTENGVRFVSFPVAPIGYHFTEIRVYVYDPNDVPPVEPTEKTSAPTFNGYTTDGIHAQFVEILPTEPSTIYYRVQFPEGDFTEWSEYEDILCFTNDGTFRIEAYAKADGKLPSDEVSYEFTLDDNPSTGINEVAAGKQVASMRYFNMAGQEMQQADGICIVVTTYTDGTTTATKVMK